MPTRFYLHNQAPAYTPATIRGAWDQTTSAVAKALDSSKISGGAITNLAIAETNAAADFDVLLGRWISGPLAAQTCSGTINVCLAIGESATAANIHWHLHIYVTQGDSDTPRGDLLTNYTEALGVNEWPLADTFKALNAAQTLAGLAVTAGDRLVVEIGYVSREASATSRNGSLWYGTTVSGVTKDDAAVNDVLVSTEVGYLDFSVAITESATPPVRLSQLGVEVLTGNQDAPVYLSQLGVEVLASSAAAPAAGDLQKVTQLVLLVAEDEDADADPPPAPIGGTDCTGGGTVASGTNPGAETSPATATTPLVWMRLTTAGSPAVVYEWAKVGIPYGTMKYARVKTFGRAKRALTDGDGAPEASRVTATLFDTDGVIRALAATGALEGGLVEYFCADLTTLQAGGTPSRRFRGYVTRHRCIEDLEYELEMLDALSARLTSIDREDLQTPQTLISSAISDLNPTEPMFDKPIPEGYGSIADAVADDPVWECKHVGNITVPGFESLGNMPAFLVCLGVQSQIKRIDGADLSSGDPPTVRAPLPASAMTGPDPYIYVPTMAGYFDVNPWYTASGRRYTLIFGKDGHPVIKLAVEGRIPLAVNFCGYETVGDSSGNTISRPARAFLHWLNTRVAQDATGNWLGQASFGDYSLFHTASFETVATYQATLGAGSPVPGLTIGGLIGADYQQRSWRDRIEEWCRNFGFSYGINRHGQGMLSILDRTDAAASAPAFTPNNILDGTVSVDLKKDAVEDAVRYVFAPEHLKTLPDLTPAPGARLFRDPYDGKWRSGLRSYGAGVRPSPVQEYNLVRVEDTAIAVATQRYDLRSLVGGRAEVTWDAWFKDGCTLELGQVVTVTHHDLPWTGTKRCQVRAIDEDFDEFTITVRGQNVHDLLP